MKLFLPLLLPLVLVACVAPKPGTTAHQELLAEQARENFLALKAQERKSAPRLVTTEAPTVATPMPPKARLKPFAVNQPFAFVNPFAKAKPTPIIKRNPPAKPVVLTTPTPAPKPPKPVASNQVFIRSEKPRSTDGTVYLYDMPNGPEPTSPRYRAYKLQYAHELAKRPQDLTPEEREWVRRHYRD
jgi:hypothetical protein